MVTNPNGANQYVLDPRQKLCWDLYINPKSETFSNGLQSAIKAGYDDEYAAHITLAPWFCEKIRRLGMLEKAEKVLEECLDMPTEVVKWEANYEAGEKEMVDVVKTEPALVKIKQDTAKFIAERVGKNEGYSTRTELTGKDGEKLIENQMSYEQAKSIIAGKGSDTSDSKE